MNTIYRFASLGCMIMMVLALAQPVRAAGTAAGTVITTQAKADFTTKTGAASTTVFSNTVSVTVLQVAALNVTPGSSAQATNGDGVTTDYGFRVTNSGNGADVMTLSAVSTKGFTRTFYHDADGNGTLSPAELAAGAITQTSSLAADTYYDVIMRVSIPVDPALNGQADLTTVTAASALTPSKTAAFAATTTVQTALFDVAASLSVLPTNATAGGNVVYTFTLTNSGGVAATGVTISDLIKTPCTYVSGTGTGFAAPGADKTANWTIGTIAPGASVTVTLTLLVDAAAPNATVLNNTMAVNYSTPGPVAHSLTSNNPYAAVGAAGGVSISLTSYAYEVEMEDGLAIPLTVKNIGNLAGVFEMSANSAHGYAWTFYKDVNNDGLFDGGDTPLTNTNAKFGVDVDVLTPGQSIKLIARVSIPTGVATDQMLDNSTLTVTSALDAAVFQSSIVGLTVNIPDIQLVRSVAPATTRMPGETNTYTTQYRNIGHGKAYNVHVVETEPDNSTYVDNSTTLNGAAKTDAADADEVTVTTVGGKKVVTVSLGTINGLSPATPGAVRFDAVVK